MKTITFGDVHGSLDWLKIKDISYLLKAENDAAGFAPFEPEFDKYIFLGDYVDSFEATNIDILLGLNQLIKFKKLYPNNVILLWGNHDIQYYLDIPVQNQPIYRCSGYRFNMHFDLYDIFNINKDLFQLAFQEKNYLWTHAGIHEGWFKQRLLPQIKKSESFKEFEKLTKLDEKLNLAFNIKLPCIFDVDPFRGGFAKVGGPLWLDKRNSSHKPLKQYHQIIGHHPVSEISTIKFKDQKSSVTYCNIYGTVKSFELKI